MSEFQAFFASNAVEAVTEDFAVSDRFVQRDEKGKPILDGKGKTIPMKWKIKGIPEEENDAIRASATKKVRDKKTGQMISESNSSGYMAKLVCACVVFPNLNDAELQKSYGVLGADSLVRKMLLSGEYANLLLKIQESNGFDKDINDLADEVKN